MNKNLPQCPATSSDCRFIEEGGFVTLMHSPVVLDGEGNPIGGGNNVITASVKCLTCKKRWIYSQTELEQKQGKDRVFGEPQNVGGDRTQ